MKKSILAALLALSVTNTGYAAPIIDYSANKLSIDIAYQPSIHFGGDADGIDGKADKPDFGITAALSDKWGLQYMKNDVAADTETLQRNNVSFSSDMRLKVEQFNLTYRCNEDTVLFAGYTKHKLDFTSSISSPAYGNSSAYPGKESKGFQIGAVQVVPVNDHLNSYGIVGIGNKLFNVEFGLSQPISDYLELNLFYKYMKCSDVNGTERDISTQGFGVGLTCKF